MGGGREDTGVRPYDGAWWLRSPFESLRVSGKGRAAHDGALATA